MWINKNAIKTNLSSKMQQWPKKCHDRLIFYDYLKGIYSIKSKFEYFVVTFHGISKHSPVTMTLNDNRKHFVAAATKLLF